MIAIEREGRIIEITRGLFTSSFNIKDTDTILEGDFDELIPSPPAEDLTEEGRLEAPIQMAWPKKARSCKHIADAVNGK